MASRTSSMRMRKSVIAALALAIASTTAHAGTWFVGEFAAPGWAATVQADTPKQAFIRRWNARPAAARGGVWATNENVVISACATERYFVTRENPLPYVFRFARFVFQPPRFC